MAGLLGPHGLPLDTIRLDGFRIDCIVGVYPQERTTPQPLEVDVSLYLDTRGLAEGDLKSTVDYARLSGELRFLLEVGHFRLLETAAHAICCYALAPAPKNDPHARVHAVRARLCKPSALGGALTPSLEIFRHAGEMKYAQEPSDFGQVETLFETKECGIYRLHIAPGRGIAPHSHRRLEESEMVLSPGLLLQNRPVRAGSVIHWAPGVVHRYDNPGQHEQTILCIDRPRFTRAEQIPCERPPAELPAVVPVSYYPEAAQSMRESGS
jgi:dihydroneopterin aldolase